MFLSTNKKRDLLAITFKNNTAQFPKTSYGKIRRMFYFVLKISKIHYCNTLVF